MSDLLTNIRIVDHKTWLGDLAEAKVVAVLIEQEVDVFRGFSGKAPFDLIAFKDDQLLRVEVKGTAREMIRGAYQIRLASTRSNRTRNVVSHFDARKSDLLAAYIRPLDTVCFLPSKWLDGRAYINLREHRNRTNNGLRNWLIGDYNLAPNLLTREPATRPSKLDAEG